MPEILDTSEDVRRAIIELYSSAKGRRVAVSAFVGEGAEMFLPRPKGIELVCWPKVGGTNPNVLRDLIKKGVVVRFSDNLHMKVYWAKGTGVIITSANLSNSALGSGNLKEFGIRLPANSVNIDSILSSIKSRPVSKREFERLEIGHREYWRRNKHRVLRKAERITFTQWMDSPESIRSPWKLCCWYAGKEPLSLEARDHVNREHNREPYDWVGQVGIGDYRKGEWLLSFEGQKGKNLRWFYVDYVARVSPREKKIYERDTPRQIVQIWSGMYTMPPFTIDSEFRRAFSKAIVRLKKVDKLVKPPNRLLRDINEFY